MRSMKQQRPRHSTDGITQASNVNESRQCAEARSVHKCTTVHAITIIGPARLHAFQPVAASARRYMLSRSLVRHGDDRAQGSKDQCTTVHAITIIGPLVEEKAMVGRIGEASANRVSNVSGHMCPSLRRVSMPRPSSCARPARSALVVVRNSVMICGMVAAQEGTVPVHGTQPRLR